MVAGPALLRDNTCLYNCAYDETNGSQALRDLMFILMNGTGEGYSVESRCTADFPPVPAKIHKIDKTIESIVVQDSKEGWATALWILLDNLFRGRHLYWDLSKIRPAGSRLKTFGGRASGPKPLDDTFKFIVGIFYGARGRKLRPFEIHSIECKIAQSVIVGGVRRSAMISLSDLTDTEMATCKTGAWPNYLAMANNSSVYDSKPTLTQFIAEWTNLYNSHSGERGICNREALKALAAACGRDPNKNYGVNPCAEIILLPHQFCNLSTVIVRPEDSLETLLHKAEIATILGTIQSTFTHFPFLGEAWEKTCNEERLLGVSMTGILSHPVLSTVTETCATWLKTLREHIKQTNIKWAQLLGIPPSKARTCIKPEGTTSCFAGTPSGLHDWFSEYYIRRVRLDNKDPLCELLLSQGVYGEPCVREPTSTMVFEFPEKANGPLRNLSAIDHLELWLHYQRHYCDHKPSVTVSYTDDEFLEIGAWVWKHWDEVSGISFLPKDDHVYAQAPFEAITAEEYEAMPKPKVDYGLLSLFEKEDNTDPGHSFACTGNGCAIV